MGSLFLINIQRKNLLQTKVGVHTRHSPYVKDGVPPEGKQLENVTGQCSSTEGSQSGTNHSLWQTFNVSPVQSLFLSFNLGVDMACLETKPQILW